MAAITGTSAITLPLLTSSIAGSVYLKRSGPAASTLPLPISSASGTVAFLVWSQKERIYNALLAVASYPGFYAISRNPSTGIATTDTSTDITPGSFDLNEVSSSFQLASRNRRIPDLSERKNWIWKLKLAFDQEIDSERVEQKLLSTPLKLPRIADKDLGQVTIRLLSTAYAHPQTSQSSRGSVVTFTFEASLPPR